VLPLTAGQKGISVPALGLKLPSTFRTFAHSSPQLSLALSPWIFQSPQWNNSISLNRTFLGHTCVCAIALEYECSIYSSFPFFPSSHFHIFPIFPITHTLTRAASCSRWQLNGKFISHSRTFAAPKGCPFAHCQPIIVWHA